MMLTNDQHVIQIKFFFSLESIQISNNNTNNDVYNNGKEEASK